MSELDEAYKRLLSWTKYMENTAESMWPQIQEALTSAEPLPDGCPSRTSMALLIFGQVQKRFAEVSGAMKDVERALRTTRA